MRCAVRRVRESPTGDIRSAPGPRYPCGRLFARATDMRRPANHRLSIRGGHRYSPRRPSACVHRHSYRQRFRSRLPVSQTHGTPKPRSLNRIFRLARKCDRKQPPSKPHPDSRRSRSRYSGAFCDCYTQQARKQQSRMAQATTWHRETARPV